MTKKKKMIPVEVTLTESGERGIVYITEQSWQAMMEACEKYHNALKRLSDK